MFYGHANKAQVLLLLYLYYSGGYTSVLKIFNSVLREKNKQPHFLFSD